MNTTGIRSPTIFEVPQRIVKQINIAGIIVSDSNSAKSRIYFTSGSVVNNIANRIIGNGCCYTVSYRNNIYSGGSIVVSGLNAGNGIV